MAAKHKTIQRTKPGRAKASAPALGRAAVIAMATRNLVNMIAVSAVSGTVLLGLMIAKRF